MGDESTAGESQMSVASSEMSVVTGGEGGGGEGRGKRMLFMAAVCIILTLGITGGIVYSGLLEYDTEVDGDDSGAVEPAGGNGEDSRVTEHGPRYPKMTYKLGTTQSTTLSTTESTTHAETKPPRIKRNGMLVCVIGSAFSSSKDLDPSLCDYMIFPDLSISGGEVVGTYGRTSWHLFKKLVGEVDPKTTPGGSFIVAHPEDPNSPISSSTLTPGILKTLTDPPLKMRALGFLGIEYTNINLASLKNYYKVFKTALSNLDKAMTFISVVITHEQDGYNFVEEIVTFSDLDTIILETHVTQIATGATTKACTTHYMSYKVGKSVSTVPTFKIAESTGARLRELTDKFRIMFSFSSGVMVFIGNNQITGYDKSCDRAFLMAEYVKDQSDGWAIFHVELDHHHLKCDLADRVAVVKTISQIARSRSSNG